MLFVLKLDEFDSTTILNRRLNFYYTLVGLRVSTQVKISKLVTSDTAWTAPFST